MDGTADSGISVSPAALSPQPPTPSETVAARNLPPRGGHNNFSRSDRGGYHGRERRERLSSRSSNITERNDDAGSVDGDNPRPRPIHTYPDSHQLFVGNLPHTVTIQEIKVSFISGFHNGFTAYFNYSKFDRVFRIFSKCLVM